jgi:hypothetical protein
MILYHPLTDAYHNLYRNLSILQSFEKSSIESDRLLIYNYFFLFPQELRRTTLPKEFSSYKKIKFQNKFNSIKNYQTVIGRLRTVQEITIQSLIGYGFANQKIYLKENKITLNDLAFEKKMHLDEVHKNVITLYKEYFQFLNLRELKERTKILEYRYEQP